MRKESQDIARAFMAGVPCKRARTMTDGQTVWLHGKRIAWRHTNGSISLTLAGWGTNTTRDRLNAITETLFGWRGYHQHKHEQYFRDKPVETDVVVTIHDPVAQERAA